VEELLETEDDSFLETPAFTPSREEPFGSQIVGTRIGRYLLQEVVSSGGMGTVYKALQDHPERTVAVKVMRKGMVSKSALRRFEYESQILARLRHPI